MLKNDGTNQAMTLFNYIPSIVPASVALGIFAALCIYLTIRIFWSKSPRFLYILAFTALMETIGFAIRVKCYFFTNLGVYVGMTLFLLLAPNALALVNYKAVGEIIRLSNVDEKRFYLKPKFVTWFFFGSDIFSFVLQGAGGGMQSTGDLMNEGMAVTLVGLSVQLVFFACFALITIYVHRSPKYNYYVEGQPQAKHKLAICLYITITLLYIRSIYRIIEYATGYHGPVTKLEWAFYVFDTIAVFLSFVVYSIFFIGNYLPKRNQEPLESLSSGEDSSNVHLEKTEY